MNTHRTDSTQRGDSESPQRKPIEAQAWLWPDQTIGKRQSRLLRKEHNDLLNAYVDLKRDDGLRVEVLKTCQAELVTLVSRLAAPYRDNVQTLLDSIVDVLPPKGGDK